MACAGSKIVVVALTRKRRILIAALAVVGILFVLAANTSRDSDALYLFLVDHPRAYDMARPVFTIIGQQDEFDRRFLDAQLKLFKTRSDSGMLLFGGTHRINQK